MNFFSGLLFGSKPKLGKNYKKLIYPFGDEQIRYEEDTYRKLFDIEDNDKLVSYKYLGIVYRENLLLKDRDEDDEPFDYDKAYKKWKKMFKHMSVGKDDYIYVEQMSKMEYEAKSINDLPSVDSIKAAVNA